ncbi:MAG TPA: response regulator transcription factor [Anaerolineales bacterium]|nr:response regulator transcription factor [Anaerolineales bacterium]
MESLICSSHPGETTILGAIVQEAGSGFRAVKDIETVVETVLQRPVDLTLLSITGESSRYLQVIRQLRVHTVIPIVMIVDPLTEDAHVELLDAGADLVVTRPFGVRVLAALLRGLLRRAGGLPFHVLPSLTQSGVTLDPAMRTVTIGSKEPVRLTSLEFRLLYTLITHPGQIVPAENLVEYVWGYTGDGNRELVRGLVQRLRTKIEPDQGNPVYILTEPGIGYLFAREAPV